MKFNSEAMGPKMTLLGRAFRIVRRAAKTLERWTLDYTTNAELNTRVKSLVGKA